MGADWQRITFTSTGYTGTSHFYVKPVSILAADTIEIWGAQMEKTASGGQAGRVSSYIPTTNLAVTRPRDNYLNGGDTSLIGAQEGVFYMEAATLANAGSKAIACLHLIQQLTELLSFTVVHLIQYREGFKRLHRQQ